MRILLAAACLFSSARAAGEGEGWEWRQTLTPHFAIKHQESWLPPGFVIGVEKAHARLRMDLGTLSPWMAQERVNLFLYKDFPSYAGGEFKPPSWSNGIAMIDSRAVALPGMKDPRKLLQVMAHETTHLLFESYFRERKAKTPVWLNEGVAMLQESETPSRPELSPWYQSMAALPPQGFPPLEAFFRVTPAADMKGSDAEAVSRWYVQAYSVALFLLRGRGRSPLQFKALSSHLRDGKGEREAVWLAYRYRTVSELDRRWREWLSDPSHRRKVAALTEEERRGVSGDLKGDPEEPKPRGPFRARRLSGGFQSLRE